MVYRIYVEKKSEYAVEAEKLKNELISLLEIESLKSLRIVNRYDAENIEKELFIKAVDTVFSEPQVDNAYYNLDISKDENVFAVEYLPGQFDQRADSAASCIEIISQKEKPIVKSAKVYILKGNLSSNEILSIKKYVINPVEAREASLEEYSTLKVEYHIPDSVKVLEGFLKLDDMGLNNFIKTNGLAMDMGDIKFCQDYFKEEKREPTITEIKMIDTYWSDHCRHTTFLTTIDSVHFEDKEIQQTYEDYLSTREFLNRKKPINLMDLATIATKYLKKIGKLDKIDESEEINACTVKIKVDVNDKQEDWLLLFKNETHNHPTEIEPFGGAATCIGGAIRDPLSGRSYVYSAMRVTGAGNPLVSVKDTMKGKLPQRKIVTTAANGYSSYGNQIGLATGMVDEIYHEGYTAKRMEIGAVIGATPQSNVRRECPKSGDIVILLGGRTGRDGCGGATGSSKSHNTSSLSTCGAEVQKGNAPEERKLQRLFRNKEATLLIKRCNDFGAGGVSVAIGELADGLKINLNKVPKKYEGLDGTELAISESQERMAVVVEKENADKFISLANGENLEAVVVAEVTEEKRLVMMWNDKKIVDIKRDFLNSNGAEKHIDVEISSPSEYSKQVENDFVKAYIDLANDLNICSKRGLSERFDSTIGAGTVLMPFGGKYQITPIQAMANKVSVEKGETKTCSMMAYGYNPFISEKSPYHGAYLAVIESVTKLIATGADFKDIYLTFQEYFEKPNKDKKRWGKPLSALLGAFKAQKDLDIAAIGGKDSMSGSFENIDVPPTLVSFAVTTNNVDNIISPELKKVGSKTVIIKPQYDKKGLPSKDSLIDNYKLINKLRKEGKILSAYSVSYGGIAEAIMKMCFGNRIGFNFNNELSLEELFGYCYGSVILELKEDINVGKELGKTIEKQEIIYKNNSITLDKLLLSYNNKLESVFPVNVKHLEQNIETYNYISKEEYTSNIKVSKPKVLIPVFPGTNCEYDTSKAFMEAGADTDIFVINNLSAESVKKSAKDFAKKINESQIVFIPGGFSGGDEPDGSGKFITAFFRNEEIKQSLKILLEEKDGLMGGICNGFQALIKLGLVPFGKIITPTEKSPTLTFNDISRHQSRIVNIRVASNKSPWLKMCNVGEIYKVPISHGEGKFIADIKTINKMAQNGQIATQYVDLQGKVTDNIDFNPNGSIMAIEGITSPDGRILGKMGHSERKGNGLYKNVYGKYDMKLFESAVKYFK